MRFLFAMLLVLLPALALAQVPSVAPAVTSAPLALATLPDGGVDAAMAPSAAPLAPGAPSVAPAPAGPTMSAPSSTPPDDVPVAEAVAFYKQAKAVVDGPTVFGLCAALASLTTLLVWGLRRFGARLLSQSKVNAAGIALGAFAGGLAAVTPQMAWWQAAFVALAPLLTTLSLHHTAKG